MFTGLLTQTRCCWLLAILLTSVAAAQQPKGRQHLVNAGDEWSELAESLRPGDEIILMPGVHRPAVLDNLEGTRERPIIIRSLNKEHLATINAAIGAAGNNGGRHGLLLRQMQHVVVQDLIITNASVHGIEAVGSRAQANADEANVDPALTIRNVHIHRIGPVGRRNGVTIRDLDDVLIEACDFEGWGGSGIEVIASNNVSIMSCTFRGLQDFGQVNAIQIRAGSERVRVHDCIMIDAGVTGVAMGGSSDADEFRNAAAADSLHEAIRVRVTSNLIRGGHSGIAYINCDQCSARNNSIIRPERWVYLILDQSTTLLRPTQRAVFAANLIQWEPGDLQQLSYVREGASDAGLTLEQNLWWSPELLRNRHRLGEPAGSSQFPQLMDIDPKLNEDFHPTEPKAGMFGRDTP